MKITKGTEINRDLNSITIFGLNGTGKTKFIETLPHDKGRILLVNVKENGTKSIKEESLEYIDVADMMSTDDLETVIELIDSGEYQSIAIDTVTQIGKLFSEEKGSNLNFEELKEVKLVMSTWFRMIKNNPNIVSLFLFQEKTYKSENPDETTTSYTDLDFYGSFRDDVRGESDYVLQTKVAKLKTKEGKLVNRFILNGVIESDTAVKVRVPNYSPFIIVNPTWNAVLKKIKDRM